MDNQLIRSLLDNTITLAAQILNTDKDVVAQLQKTRDQLPPNQIGKHGQLQEWLDDVDAPNNNHRHMSPLWALYPGADISPAGSETLGRREASPEMARRAGQHRLEFRSGASRFGRASATANTPTDN